MPVSRLDVMYRKILLTKFFTQGWGPPDDIIELFNFRRVISNRDACYKLVPKDHPIEIINEQRRLDCRIIEGKFRSPFVMYQGGLMAPEIKDAFFQMVLPLEWPTGEHKPICIHLAGTGDHYFWRRRNIMAKPLLHEGIGAIILENPYYGLRKPKTQLRSSLRYVSDIFVMGGSLILECIALLNWCESLGFGPLGISGISMGGHMASLAASNWPKPLVLVPCLSWSTASSVFTEGVMSESIDWDLLQNQLFTNRLYCDTLSKACRIVNNPFPCNDVSKITDTVTTDADTLHSWGYVSPYEMMNRSEERNRPATASYKSSQTSQKTKQSKNKWTSSEASGRLLTISDEKNADVKRKHKEAVWLMRGMMDEFTHLKNFSVPHDPSLITAVCAKADGYVPRTGTSNLEDVWPGSTVRYVDTGHVGAYIWYMKLFRSCIVETFEKAKNNATR